MSRLLSYLNLALRFNLHFLRKPFSVEEEGKARFLQNYRADHIFPVSQRLRQRMPDYQRCIACGLCDTTCPNLAAARRHLFNGPSDLASALTRNLPDFHLLGPYLEGWHACGDCLACEAICPTGVPLRELAGVVEELMRRETEE